MAPALHINPGELSGPSSQRGSRAGGQDFVCRPGCPSCCPPILRPGSGEEQTDPMHTIWFHGCWLAPFTLGISGLGTMLKPLLAPTAHNRHYCPKGFSGLCDTAKSYLSRKYKAVLIILLLQPSVFAHRLPPPSTNMHPYSISPPIL